MKKINKAEEIENIYLREWFEEHEEKVKDSDFLISLKGRHNLASLQQIKEKPEARQTKKPTVRMEDASFGSQFGL